MVRLRTIGAAVLASGALGGEALAQTGAPITNRDVLGEWTLTLTPAERRGMSITFESADGGPVELPLSITGPADGPLRCAVRGDPASCRVREGKLVVDLSTQSGGARMTFTLTDRTRGGFSGDASMRIRLLPIGGRIGLVDMAPRQGGLPTR